MGVKPYADARGASIVFLNNTIAEAKNKSLLISKSFPAHARKVLNNKLNIVCDCKLKTTLKYLMGISENNEYYDETRYHTVTETTYCQENKHIPLYKIIDKYYHDKCELPIPLPIIISASTVVVAVIIIIIVCVVCNRNVQKAKEEANYLGECCYSQSFSTLHSNPGPHSLHGSDNQCHSWDRSNNVQPWIMAVPEVKTYQETELHVLYEHTQPINANNRDSFPVEPRLDILRKTEGRSSCPFN